METNKNAVEKNKLCVLFIIIAFGEKLSDNQLLSICTELELMDYFDLNTSLGGLADAGLLDRSEAINGIFYSITQMGESTFEFFKKQLPFSTRETISAFAAAHKDEYAMQARIYSEYMQLTENQFRVMLKILENDLPIFEINLFAHTKEEAEGFAVAWRLHAAEIYENTISGLLKK